MTESKRKRKGRSIKGRKDKRKKEDIRDDVSMLIQLGKPQFSIMGRNLWILRAFSPLPLLVLRTMAPSLPLPQPRGCSLSQPSSILLIYGSALINQDTLIFLFIGSCTSDSRHLYFLCLKHPCPFSWFAPSFCLFTQGLPGCLISRSTHSIV